MFGSNVGLENVSSSNRIEGACHGIPNSGNTCYIGKAYKSGVHGRTASGRDFSN